VRGLLAVQVEVPAVQRAARRVRAQVPVGAPADLRRTHLRRRVSANPFETELPAPLVVIQARKDRNLIPAATRAATPAEEPSRKVKRPLRRGLPAAIIVHAEWRNTLPTTLQGCWVRALGEMTRDATRSDV